MKILFVLEHYYPYIGGAEKLFYVLTTSLAKKGYEITVVTTLFDKTLAKEEVHEGVKIIRVDCYNRYLFTVLSLPQVIKYAKQADFIHTTTYTAALPAAIAGRLSSKPVFITFHEVWGTLWQSLPFTSTWQSRLFYHFEQLLLRLPFYKFIAVSEFTKTALVKNGISPSKIEMIYNGIDYEPFKAYAPTPPEVFTFTYFGRLGISKGLDLLLPAAAKFRKSHPKSRFNLIIPQYPKPLYKKIMALVKQYDLEDYINFHHNLPRQELYKQLLSSSCVVISSYSEGFCFAAVETVALNIPIISSNQGALKETVSGKYIPMANMSIDALTAALAQAYDNEWKERPLRYFHLQDSVMQYEKCYVL